MDKIYKKRIKKWVYRKELNRRLGVHQCYICSVIHDRTLVENSYIQYEGNNHLSPNGQLRVIGAVCPNQKKKWHGELKIEFDRLFESESSRCVGDTTIYPDNEIVLRRIIKVKEKHIREIKNDIQSKTLNFPSRFAMRVVIFNQMKKIFYGH